MDKNDWYFITQNGWLKYTRVEDGYRYVAISHSRKMAIWIAEDGPYYPLVNLHREAFQEYNYLINHYLKPLRGGYYAISPEEAYAAGPCEYAEAMLGLNNEKWTIDA